MDFGESPVSASDLKQICATANRSFACANPFFERAGEVCKKPVKDSSVGFGRPPPAHVRPRTNLRDHERIFPMPAPSLSQFYLSARETSLSTRTTLRRESRRIVFLRTATFALAVFTFAAGYDGRTPFYALAIALAFIFVRLVTRHHRIAQQILTCDAELSVLSGILARFDDSWKQLPEDGAGRLSPGAPPQFADLHVFGPASLYQYLCRARTKAGRDRLAASFRTKAPDDTTLLRARHGALRELAEHRRLALTLETCGALLPEGHDTAPLLALLDREGPRLSRWRITACVTLVPLNLITLLCAATGLLSWLIPGTLLALSFLLAWLTARQTDQALALLGPLATSLAAYEQLFRTIEQSHFHSPHLAELQSILLGDAPTPDHEQIFAPTNRASACAKPIFERAGDACKKPVKESSVGFGRPPLTASDHEPTSANVEPTSATTTTASQSLHRLALLASWVAARRNFFFYALANALFLFDFAAGLSFRRWCRTDGARLPRFLAVWSEFEVLLSLSTIPATRVHFCYPEFLPAEKGPHITAQALENPLLSETTAVPNSADLAASTTIVTGSNMSGKTTWLRTLGMSAILAWAGAPVCAERFALSPLALYTSIRVDDDLAHGISTFYAELLRIKTMVAAEETGQPLLLLIDEIFKGTNSADRITGAEAALSRLTNDHTIALVSTHDFELCTLEPPGGIIRNAHFEEHYEDGKIAFDYRLREGRCVTTNAEYLLKMVGIL